MTTQTGIQKMKTWIDTYLGTTYKMELLDNKSVEVDWHNLIPIIICVILLITAWIMLVSTVRKMDMLIEVGKRSQEECGKNYMERETARNRLYMEYTDKIGNSLKTVNSLLIIIIGIAFATTLINLGVNLNRIRSINCKELTQISGTENIIAKIKNKTTMMTVVTIIIILALVATFISYVQQNTQIKFQNKYTDAIKYSGSMSTTTLLLLAFGASFVNIIMSENFVLKDVLSKPSSAVFIWIVLLSIVFVFIYMMNINTIKINNDYIVPYGSSVEQINKDINALRKLDCDECTIQEGAKKGMQISKWMNLMLSRNIMRANPDEENGDPLLILEDTNTSGSNKYLNTLYAYIEHSLGKELQELPENVAMANKLRTNIRQKFRYIRRNNDSMIQPVKSFVIQIATITAILVGVAAFLLYHLAYINSPTATTIAVSIMGFVFLVIALGIYSWNMGRSKYM